MKLKEINWKTIGIELLYVTAIALVCVKMAYALSDAMDIQLYDESTYLYQGNHFHLNYLFKDGFIYLAWYKLLSLFIKDTIILYYFNYTVLLCLNPFLIYILLRKMGKERLVSAFFAILFAISNINITAWPFITRLALAIILCTFTAALSIKNNRTRYLTALFGLSLLVYTRPEYTLSLFIFSLAAVVYLLYRFSKSHERALLFLLFLTLLLNIFIFFVKNPASAKRSVIAFGQHYGVHLYMRGEITVDPSLNWKEIMKKGFGTNQSIIKAFLNNPKEMARHVYSNIKYLPNQSMQFFSPYNTKNKSIKKILLVIMGLSFIFLMARAIKQRKKQGFLQGEHAGDDIFYFLSILIIIPPVISVFFIFPRAHYLLVLFVVLAIMAAKNLPRSPDNSISRWISYALILLILYGVPWQATGAAGLFPGPFVSIHDRTCTNVGKIKSIRSMQGKATIVMLGSGGSFRPYIDNFQYVGGHTKNVPFDEFIKREKINMMIIDKGLLKDPHFKYDAAFENFIAEIPGNNWLKINMPHCKGYMVIKREIPE